MPFKFGTQYCFAPAGDDVAIAIFLFTEHDGKILQETYASTTEQHELASSIMQRDFAETFCALCRSGTIFTADQLFCELTRTYQIEDHRFGCRLSYIVSGDRLWHGRRLLSRMVYCSSNNGAGHVIPTYWEVLGLRDYSNVFVVDDSMGPRPLGFDDTAVGERWDFGHAVIVTDLGAVGRSRTHRRAA